ncbi:MAG TPA: hypothetical protein VL123_09585 [Candidatus Udaeobacter sp.]|jgi:hypothetical protein|nr:hypothetical protein [Candidatus Udaeobacter sp.]
MDSRYSVRWMRRGGEVVAIEDLDDLELIVARERLDREDGSDPVAAAMLDAVRDELHRRKGSDPVEIVTERRAA